MGKKIFISYKYADLKVRKINGICYTKVRDYVDEIQAKLDDGDHINKGEDDGEDMSSLSDSTISSKLGDKIFDSSVTIVLISKGMKDDSRSEKEQWIPWEISYSLKEQSRNSGRSKSNAILAVVLPDENDSYDYYYMQYDSTCNSISYNNHVLFNILKNNMFNHKNPTTRICNGKAIHEGLSSYIHCVKWDDFVTNIDDYIDIANSIKDNIEEYNLVKTLT